MSRGKQNIEDNINYYDIFKILINNNKSYTIREFSMLLNIKQCILRKRLNKLLDNNYVKKEKYSYYINADTVYNIIQEQNITINTMNEWFVMRKILQEL